MFKKAIQPPVAKRITKTTRLHNETLHDNYYWLRNIQDPDVKPYLHAENQYLETVMQPTQALQETLYQEMLSHIQEEDINIPVQDGPYFYYARTEANKQYPIYCRKRANSRKELDSQPEEVIVDFNHIADGKAFFSVSQIKISPDHNKLAYLQNENGTDYYTLYVKDIVSEKDLIEPIENIYIQNSLEWDESGQYLFYVTANTQQRPNQIHRFSLSRQSSVLTYEEADESYFIYLNKTQSGKFIIATISTHLTTEIHYLSAETPEASWSCFAARMKGVSYELEHHQDSLFS